MKKYILFAFIALATLTVSTSTYAQKHKQETPTAAAQIKDVASSTVGAVKDGATAVIKTTGNLIDSGKVAVTNGVTLVDTSHNFRAFYNDIKGGLVAAGTALKVGAEHVYMVIVKQQVVKAVSDLILLLALFGLAYFLFKTGRKAYNKHLTQCGYDPTKGGDLGKMRSIDLDDTAQGIVSVVLTVLSIITAIGAVCVLCVTYSEIISGLINPEFGAMKDIIEFVKSAKG